MSYRVAVIGTGPGREYDISGRTHSWAYHHGDGYAGREDSELVACVDLVREYAEQYAREFSIPEDGVFRDHEAMLDAVRPDIVSIATPIPKHAPLTIDCARSGVQAVHCEKPFARTWAEARAMAHVCDRHDVQLTIAHQRRFGAPFRTAKVLVDDGEIGVLKRVEISYGNFFDRGSHAVDMAGYLVDESRGSWVLGQVDYSKSHVRYGVPVADHAFVSWQYENGVHGVTATGGGDDQFDTPHEFDFFDCFLQLIGTDGEIVIDRNEGPALEIRRDGGGYETVDVPAEQHDPSLVTRAIDDVIDSLSSGRESTLRAANALNTAEILFAGHESSRRRQRVELPLTGVYDHPLESLVELGEVSPIYPDDRPAHPADER
ncbi:glucose-fructose oxidoreductase (plasmid) [Salinigranum rubrum]|uniref:Glucose-fructose oxidoreductase n=1 Tax=Salinigranum rubrum TaxID=755307 RepID=A0A2I8VRS5_9EURY|nr:Gfo/Idh/MocA family oxidoreductase [Salinigranum rubrum]AUV84630.1 glucose-fructose oxidoreductase [Salinigranum rubrum]